MTLKRETKLQHPQLLFHPDLQTIETILPLLSASQQDQVMENTTDLARKNSPCSLLAGAHKAMRWSGS
jgi:hypothetical protein